MHAPRLTVVLFVLIAALACLPAAAQVVTSTIGVGGNYPASAAVNTVTNTIYAANECGSDPTCTLGGGSVTVINGATLATQTVQVDAYPYPIRVDTGLNQIYTATCGTDPTCSSPGAVTVINGGTLATTNITAGYYVSWVVVNPVTHYVYVVNLCDSPTAPNCTSFGTVTVINGNNLNAPPVNVNVGAFPYRAAVNPTTNMIYVMNGCGSDLDCRSPGTVSVINGNTNQVTATIGVGYGPETAAVDQVNNLIYVTNYYGANGSGNPGTVSVINGATNTVEATINVGVYPFPVLFNPNTDTIYVGNRCGSDPNCVQPPSATVINGNTLLVTATVPICRMETYPYEDSEIDLTTNKVYFPCQGRPSQGTTGLSVTVLDGATNATTPVAVGDYPYAAAVNSVTNQIYVPNAGDNTVSVIGGATKLQLINVTPCRLVDTRQTGGPIQGGTSRSFTLPQLGGCNIPPTAGAYSLNVTVIPTATLGYLTIWPTGVDRPVVSTMNSLDGRIKADAVTVQAGVSGAVSVYVTNTANVVLDIDAYYAPDTPSTLEFYPLTPCRVLDTRNPNGPLGGPYLQSGQERDFPVRSGDCQIPSNAQAYSMNFTVVPYDGQPLGYLTVWPTGQSQPGVSTLNNLTATIVANAAIVPAGTGGDISAYPSGNTQLVGDINGYFAAPGQGGQSLYPTPPCRVLDTRQGNGAFTGELTVNVVGSACAPPSTAEAYVFNATVVPVGPLGYLTLWPDGENQPIVSTLNAIDGAITSNMAIVPTNNGSIDAYASGVTQLILDIYSYFAP
jgi:YVTN family beta-propeller protein